MSLSPAPGVSWVMLLTLLLLLSTPSPGASEGMNACVAAQEANTYEAWADYLKRFPGGSCAATPFAIDARDCELTTRQDTEGAWRQYISQHPGGLCIERALERLPAPEELGPAPESPLAALENASRVVVEPPSVLGGMSEAAVVQALEVARPSLGQCHASAALLNPDLQGRVELRFQVSQAGDVRRVRVRSSSLGHSGVEACLVRVVQELRLAPPRDKALITVSIRLQSPPAD